MERPDTLQAIVQLTGFQLLKEKSNFGRTTKAIGITLVKPASMHFWIVLNHRGGDFSTYLTVRAGDARRCVGPQPAPTLAGHGPCQALPTFRHWCDWALGQLWLIAALCCADPTLYFDVPWRRPRYKQLWHNDFGSCTSMGLPLFSGSSFTCNFCTVDMRYVADSRTGAKLFSTLRFLPNTPEAHF